MKADVAHPSGNSVPGRNSIGGAMGPSPPTGAAAAAPVSGPTSPLPSTTSPTQLVKHSDGSAVGASGGSAHDGNVSTGGRASGNVRSSESGMPLSAPGSPPGPLKGSSYSGTAPAAQASASASASSTSGAAGRRLQQLGQRLNFVGLGRKKQTSFAPSVTGGSVAGGNGGGGGGALSGGEEGGSVTGGGLGFGVAGAGGSGGVVGASGPSMLTTAASGGEMRGGVSGASPEAFNPPNHPVNPFSYLATPFRVMAKSKAGAAMGRYATTALRLKRDGMPPASYMWLWLGNFKRWQRRYFVASEAPGVLLIYKRADMKGKVWSTSLVDASVTQDDSHVRQLRLVSPGGTIFLRVLRPEERQPWLACLSDSVATYRKHKEVVDTLAAATGGKAGDGGEATVGGALPGVASGAVEQDAEQRRRIRARLSEKLSELAPLVTEVERHMGLVGAQLAGATSGLGRLSGPLLPTHTSLTAALSNRSARNPAAPGGGIEHGGHSVSIPPSHLAPHPAPHASQSGAAAADAALASPSAVAADAAVSVAAAPSPAARPSTTGRTRLDHLAAGGVGLGEREASQERLTVLGRSRSRSRASPGHVVLAGAQATSLSGAVAALVDAMRATLHNDAVRIATLEAENAALNKTLHIVRTNTHRSGARSRGLSTPGQAGAAGLTGGAAARAAAAAMAGSASVGHAGGDDVASEGSVRTADEDAFDVVEAFDEDVDYSILDNPSPHMRRRLGVDDDEGGPFVPHGHFPPGADDEEDEDDDEEAEEDAAELAQQATVLNALEVVRQVEYIAANRNTEQLTTLLAADTPPPPDAEEEEQQAVGGKSKHKGHGRGKGEDTEGTIDEDDDDDSDGALVSGGDGSGSGGSGGAPGVPGALAGRTRVYDGRDRLPAPKPLGRGFSIWSILKNMIGRDLTKITMPATINEPLSMTQRMCEVLENRSLLERAASTPDSMDRLMLVSCWLLAGYNSQPSRDNKPFNPLLGETFEWQAPDGSARFLCEQVSHHPPISCFVGEGGAGDQGYSFYGEVETKTKFWGKTIECILAGHMMVKLNAFGEEYRFNLGTITINDIILGRFWIDLSCDMKIRNTTTGESSRLVIKPCRGYREERGKCEAVVCDADGKEVWRIGGSTMVSLHAALTPEAAAERGASTEPQLIWTRAPALPNPHEQYCMTRFALGMNDPADPIVPYLPHTDARFRPDMRALELGEWNRATSEKLRLEEKQRTARRVRKEAGVEYKSRWFRQILFNTKEMTQLATQPGSVWESTGEYWAAREQKQWGELPDIY